ncbi:MAG: TonB-dependent receptor [Xanthomonadaceae bacterium]|nr:TonB-dependent receptor [Xanthomonadaceae bacterium]
MATKTSLLSSAIRSALAIGLIWGAAAVPAAFAQESSTAAKTDPSATRSQKDAKQKPAPVVGLKAVTVTGSRIPSVDLETQQPIFSMTQEDIKKTGLTNVGDIVQQLTMMSLPGTNKSSVLSGASGAFVNMRNLGSQRVLVLVNGKRWISGINGATDISNIPAALIERIEVLKDGASAVYGSDAISGVINFILKDRFDGSQFNAYYGENQGGDAQTTQYSFTTGARTDKSSIVFNVNYNKTGVVWTNSRDITRYAYSPNHPYGTLEAGPWGLIYNSPANPGQYLMLNHTATQSSDPRDPANYHVYTGNPADQYNFTAQKMYQMPTQLNSIFTHATYDIADNVTAKMTAMYSDRQSSDQIAGDPLNYNAQRNFPVYVDAQSYYNPFPGTNLLWNRMMTEIPPFYRQDYKSYHLDGSIDGYFELGEHEWDWSVGFNYNRGQGTTHGTGEWNLLALKKALGPSFLNADGVVQCGTPTAPIPLGPSYQLGQCTPVPILAGPGGISAQQLAYILAPSTDTFGSTDRSYNFDINGTLFDLPAGGLGFAGGVESRQLSGYSRPDSFAQTGYTSSNAANSTTGKYRVNSAYVEFNAPLLKDLPGVQSLSVDFASRYSHYSNFGSTTDNKYSFEWKPVSDLLIRGNYAEGFRAPTLQDLFGGGGQGYDHYLDQCDSVYGAAATNASVAAICAAQGVPANFRQRDRQGLPITSVGATQSATPSFIGVGNANLKPETAVTRTLGAVYSPSFVPGLDLTLDWYSIRINNEIQSISAQYVVNQCYLFSSAQYCSQLGRDATTSQITTLSRGNANLGHISTKGYDFTVSYRFPETRYGNFVSRLDSNYVSQFQSQSGAGATVVNSVGIIPQYRVRANLTTSWSIGSFGATWRLRYFGALRDECYTRFECNQPNYRSPSWPFGVGANRKGAISYNDVSGYWKAPWNATLSIGINNVFDKKPSPLYSAKDLGYNGAVGFDPELDIDRYIYVSYQQKF